VRKVDLYLLLKNRRINRSLDTKGITTFLRPVGKGVIAVLSVLVLGALFAGGLFYTRVAIGLPSVEILPVLLNPVDGELLQPTRLTDRSGEVTLLTLENPGINRQYMVVNPDEPQHFSPQLIRAIIAKIDPGFWENPGYSIVNWRDPQPATIAESLADDLLLWQEPASAVRPLRMRLLAAQLVTKYGRTQVLEWFLNSAYFGHLSFGAESASQLYFEKSSQDLTLAESAMLAVLLDAPALNPLDAPSTAIESQRQFLVQLAETQTITTDEFSTAVRQELKLRKQIAEPASTAPAFTRQVLTQLEPLFTNHSLERGGLVISTTLDANLQQQFACAAVTQLLLFEGAASSEASDGINQCQAALFLPTQFFTGLNNVGLEAAGLIMDPQTGEVLAYLGPTSYSGEVFAEVNYQPGTLISPFVALSGFARGFSPASMKWDAPSTIDPSLETIRNPDGKYHGPVSLRSAIVDDYIIPVIQLSNQVSLSNVWTLAQALGYSSFDNSSANSIYTSQLKTNLLQIGQAYGTFANSGLQAGAASSSGSGVTPNLALYVKSDSGRILIDRSQPVTSQVLSLPLAYLINNILSDESTRREAFGYPNSFEIGLPVAVKSGQIADKSQVWTVGYTPQRLVITWMGIAQPGSTELNPLVSAGLWNAMTKYSSRDLPISNWPMPAGVTVMQVCVPSGMLPSMDCPTTREEVFLSGNEPVTVDTLYEKVQINRETGQRATVFTSPEQIEERTVMNVPPEFKDWAIKNGLPIAPAGYDSIPQSSINPYANISEPALFGVVSGKVSILGTASGPEFSNFTIQIGEGINPRTWQQIGLFETTPINEGPLAEWDTTGLNGLYAIRLVVVNSKQEIQSAVIQVTVDNTPPTIKINYPVNDQTVRLIDGAITLTANVEDSSTIQKVEWFIDGKLSSTQTNAPFLMQLKAKEGKHTLQVKAQDAVGNTSQSSVIQFTVAK
jgi:membrane peptidoglycan carboxypeptidase